MVVAEAQELSWGLLCNCYAYVKAKYPSLPRTALLEPNTTPHVGAVAIFDYPHYAIIVDFDEKGFWVDHTNFKKCVHNSTYFTWDNAHLLGFWAP